MSIPQSELCKKASKKMLFDKKQSTSILNIAKDQETDRESYHFPSERNSEINKDKVNQDIVSGVNEMKENKPYIFSADMLPVKYDRNSQSALPMKTMVCIELTINAILVIIFVIALLKGYENTWFGIMQYVITCSLFVFTMFWLNYKLHVIFINVYRLFMDFKITLRNDKYYSGLEIPDFYVQTQEYPHITIQIPVYKEDLQHVLRPTLLNCCREADRYMDETGAFCNVVVCDDGYNCISKEEKLERLLFYQEIGVGFTARPHPSKYPRNGRFKKAGNLNFSMNYSEAFMNGDVTAEQKAKKDELVALGACYGGDVSYGSYILLIDSDTRLPIIPVKDNGCLKRLAKEMMFDGQNVLFIQCYTGPYMSVKSSSEKCIFHHTCNIYNSILIATAIRSMAPLVGHNAFLNKKAMLDCAKPDKKTGYLHFWAEDRISEDFNLMMRGCNKGYNGRYATYAGIFLEGVSFSYMTEYFKIAKFACGAAELIYNPVSHWLFHGVVSSDLIGFVTSKEVEWYNKLTIVAYVFNFIALASAHFGLIFNMFFCEWLYKIVPLALMPVNLMWESIIVWSVLGGTLAFLFGLRLGFSKWLLFKQVVREAAFLTCFYGSISVRFSLMSFTHLFGWNLSFGATSKDDDTVTLMDWIRSTPIECSVYTLYAALMVARIFFYTAPDKINFVLYFGCTPLIWTIFLFWAGPIFWDILPRKKDKTAQASYVKDDMMFVDKYMTQLPNSPVVQKMKKVDLVNVKQIPRARPSVTSIATEDSGIWSPNGDLMTPAQSEKNAQLTQAKADKKLRDVQNQVALLESKLAKLATINELSSANTSTSQIYIDNSGNNQVSHKKYPHVYDTSSNDDTKDGDDHDGNTTNNSNGYYYNDLASVCTASDSLTSSISIATNNPNVNQETIAKIKQQYKAKKHLENQLHTGGGGGSSLLYQPAAHQILTDESSSSLSPPPKPPVVRPIVNNNNS